MKPRLLSQKRAAYALERVQEAHEDQDYARLCRDLPAMLLQNGLGQSLAFLLSKRGEQKDGGQKAAGRLYADVSGWLIQERGVYAGGDLVEAVINGDRNEYMAAQEEALELCGWLKRFADALMGRDER
ncbi:MAG: type III-B CRISPR module-associated protein Cmr5 [Rubrobacter sp.]|jgi:CRISPR-associated protein Cmr5|nr:type III-B CRISPR module-associated protein Cmr5 [Rubrobacter sp.]